MVVLTAVALVGCDASDDESSAPLPIPQRFLTAEEAPGSKPDPDETRQTTMAFDEFTAVLSDASVDPDREEIAEVFQNAGFTSGGVDTRFYGAVHTPGESTHVVSSFIEVESEEGAASALDWLEDNAKKRCPMSCATQISSFDVDDISGARGVRRIATADDIERVGTTNERPFESYLVAFADGAIVYTVDLFGRPGSVSEDQALQIASAYYDRLTGA